MADEPALDAAALFAEPAGFRPATPPSTVHVVRRAHARPGEREQLQIELVGQHSLWAHCLWNAGVVLGEYLDEHRALVEGKRVLEFGAAAAVPSLVAALDGASKVVITEYPEQPLLDTIERNVARNVPDAAGRVVVQGFLWNKDPAPLLLHAQGAGGDYTGYDLIILSDLVFNHREHDNLLRACLACLRPDGLGQVLVCFTSHRPWLAHKDHAFMPLAASDPYNFVVEPVFVVKRDPMFPEDPGDVDVRSTVYCFRFTRPAR